MGWLVGRHPMGRTGGRFTIPMSPPGGNGIILVSSVFLCISAVRLRKAETGPSERGEAESSVR